ncbi:MAG TPA: serine/threonine-protein kinase [Gemmatimonadaceae bacterium]|nr:serine/threonine-protein kinase [Gemmatimonadaceae bacterium]
MPAFHAELQDALGPSYQLDRELTGGGMSRVFVATETGLGRTVVIKVLPPELAAGVNHERFRREIHVAAQLQHPHVVPLLSAGEHGAFIWYTMPFIQGQSVREALAKGRRFAVREVVKILRDVAEALAYAHGLGVIHRDIKPGNVLLLGSHALVTDFGVSKAISASIPTSGFTSAGMAIGTPAYMAPEQIAADPAADHRMDLYALGLLAYELLTGEMPFKEDSPQKTMAAQLTRDPAPVETSRADVPPALSALVRRLLAKVPDDRPQLAADVVTALDDIALTSGQSIAPLRPTRRAGAWRTVGVAAAGVLVVVAAWAIGQRSSGSAGENGAAGNGAANGMVGGAVGAAGAIAPAAAMLTREDSIAIARAVARQMADRPRRERTESRGVDSVSLAALADSLRVQVQRFVLDSLIQMDARRVAAGAQELAGAALAMSKIAPVPDAAARVAPPGAPGTPSIGASRVRRVVIAMPRPSRERPAVDAMAAILGDSLRARLAQDRRFVVVDADSAADVLRESRTVETVRERLDADLVLAIAFVPGRDSLLVRMVHMRDLTAQQGFGYRVVTGNVSLRDAPTKGVSEFLPRVLGALNSMLEGQPNPPSARPPRRP